MRLARENDGEHLASWKCFTECQHQVISDRLHDLDGASKLVVRQVKHRSWAGRKIIFKLTFETTEGLGNESCRQCKQSNFRHLCAV